MKYYKCCMLTYVFIVDIKNNIKIDLLKFIN